MFESMEEKIPIYLDFESMVRYHFGIFAFNGAGKSKLLANTLRRILLHAPEIKLLVFDSSSEYPFLSMDLFADEKIPSKIILENPVSSADQFYVSVVKPRDYENDDRVRKVFARIFSQKKISYYLKPESKIPTYGDILDELGKMRGDNLEKPHYINALDRIRQFVMDYKQTNANPNYTFVNKEFLIGLDQAGQSQAKDVRLYS